MERHVGLFMHESLYGVAENDANNKKTSSDDSYVGEDALVIREVREEWPAWIKLTGRQQLPSIAAVP